MSNIIILFHQEIIVKNETTPKIVCNYEAFASELSKAGNNVKVINTNYIKNYWDSSISKLNKNGIKKLIFEIINFKPDMVFTFNNQVFSEIFSIVDCPICCMDADSVDFFPNKEFISKYKDRYYFVTSYSGWEDSCYESLGIIPSRIGKIHSATAVQREDLYKDKNISFIGSVFPILNNDIYKNISDKQQMSQDIRNYYGDLCLNFDKFADKYTKELRTEKINLYPLCDPRLYVLKSVWDLGLTIYGIHWENLPNTEYLLKLAYDDTPKYSLKHNQDVYNSSKINISVSHPQCKGYTYPWRALDIMASSGLLISSYSKLLEEQTKGYVNIPMYKSPWEARELCLYALNNPNWSEDIISASNEYIEKFGRWKDNFEVIENLTGVKLLNLNNVNQKSFDIMQIDKFSTKRKFEFKYKLNLKKRIKNVINGFSLVCMNLPILEILYSKKIREKIYSSIIKYKGN